MRLHILQPGMPIAASAACRRQYAGGEPLTIAKSDYDAFDRLLGDVQAAYSAEDLNALRAESNAGDAFVFFRATC